MSRRAGPVEDSWGWSEFLEYFRQELGPLSTFERGYVPWLAASPDFATAVERAIRSRMPDGTMHNHQTRVRASALAEFGRLILSEADDIRECATFHAMWSILDAIAPWGIGPLTVYDVAERIGRYLRLEPTVVYLHAGPTLGARALGIPIGKRRWLLMSELPEPMQTLKADEAEDFLCVFSSYLSRFKP